MTNSLNIAAYGEGIMYTPTLATNMSAIQQAGWTSVILSLFHINNNQDIIFNNTVIIQNGQYIGDSQWPGQVAQLTQSGTITTLLASVGGGGVTDFQVIQQIYNNNNNSFAGTPLQTNFQVFRKTFPTVSIIDMDCEDNYDLPSFVGFCEMLAQLGFGITFCPYATWEMSFWTGALSALNTSYPGAVKWWNLQCYAGGGGNNPADWATAIENAIPGFDTSGFILASDWSRFWNTQYSLWEGDCPVEVSSMLSQFASEPCVGGAFIWNIDQIIQYPEVSKQHPDPDSCGNVGMANYVAAIQSALQ